MKYYDSAGNESGILHQPQGRELGLTVPNTLIGRADEAIE
jgi:hypothetical protein